MPEMTANTITLETVVCEGQQASLASSSRQPADARLSESSEERRIRFHAFLTKYRAQYRAAEKAWNSFEKAPGAETPEDRKRRFELSLLPVFV